MDSPSPPKLPDPVVVANAQGTANQDAARTTTTLNRADQITPYGSLIWHQGSATPVSTLDNVYQQLLGRDADPYGRQYYTQEMNNGKTWGDIEYQIKNSPEYQQRVQANGGVAPDLTMDANGNPTGGNTGTSQDHWWSEIQLDPRVQGLMDSQLATSQGLNDSTSAALDRVKALMGTGIDYSKLPAAGSASGSEAAARSNFTDLNPMISDAKGLTGQANGILGDEMGRLGTQLGQPLPSASEGTRQQVIDALYGQATSRLDPQYQQEDQVMRDNLMNRGVVEGSDAWNSALANQAKAKTDAYQQAMWNAIEHGGTEQDRLLKDQLDVRDQGLQEAGAAQGLQAGLAGQEAGLIGQQGTQEGQIQNIAGSQFGMQNSERQDALTEQEKQRAMVLNELASLRSGQQVDMPNFGGTPSGTTVNPSPIAQSMWNAYQGNLNQYNTDVGSNNAMMGGGMSAMAAIAAAFI